MFRKGETVSAYISYGGGRNSTAMTILILTDDRFADLRDGLRIVFADTGAEMPETICYVNYFSNWLKREHDITIETVSAGNLIEYCEKHRMVPSRMYRWCTRIFKVQPLEAFAKKNGCTLSLIGFDAGEAHRSESNNFAHKANRRFPLIEANIDLAGCIKIIQDAGLEVPKKSGCWCCPFARKAHFEDLRTYKPDLWERALALEENADCFQQKIYLKDKPLREWLQNPGLELDEPCAVCELMNEKEKEVGSDG